MRAAKLSPLRKKHLPEDTKDITIDHTGQKDSVVNDFYYSVMADAKDLDAMIGMHSHYYGTKGGYWIEIDFYQELGDEYKGYATIGYYKK